MFPINPNIAQAATLPAAFYTSQEVFALLREKVFARSWQLVGDANQLKNSGTVLPFTLLEGFIDEPLLLTRPHDNALHCLSNVCTHRGNILCVNGGTHKSLTCSYHGRKFGLDGKFAFMPEFKEAENFPTEADNLPALPLKQWKNLLFTSFNPAFDFSELVAEMAQRIGWLPLEEFVFAPQHSLDYTVNAHWALYCDNYLEGFHIPYVHAALNELLDYGNYTSELYKYSNLQLGIASKGEDCFDLPKDSPDYGKDVAAYYYWLFPNMMLNFYPWGCSVNIVKPMGLSLTRISYLTYIWKPELYSAPFIDRVEKEDEAIIELVQKGVRSRLYKQGRFSPKREQGVHHFHSLLSAFLG